MSTENRAVTSFYKLKDETINNIVSLHRYNCNTKKNETNF